MRLLANKPQRPVGGPCAAADSERGSGRALTRATAAGVIGRRPPRPRPLDSIPGSGFRPGTVAAIETTNAEPQVSWGASYKPPRLPLLLSRVHWVEPKLVAQITYLTWTADNLLRHTVYVGLREYKPADQVRREATRG